MLTIREAEANPDDGLVEFGTLKPGDCFVFSGRLYVKSNESIHDAYNFSQWRMGAFSSGGTRVLPVDGELIWRRKR